MTVAHICSDPKFCHYCLTDRAKAAEDRVAELQTILGKVPQPLLGRIMQTIAAEQAEEKGNDLDT